MNGLAEIMSKNLPKYILILALILLAAFMMSIVWPELRPELIDLEEERPFSRAEESISEVSVDTIEASMKSTGSSPRDSIFEFPVYITGAVNKPGLYYVKEGAILADIVSLAGGLHSEAALDYINLARVLFAHEMTRIPYIEEIQDDEKPPLQEGEARISESLSLVNINEAGEDLLSTLPGIGISTAKAIISWRDENGPFASIEDIMQVSGIKEARFNQIKDLITV